MNDDDIETVTRRGAFERLLTLIEDGRLAVNRAAVLELKVPLVSHPVDFDRVAGMMLGLAIGDALGNTSEAQVPRQRRKVHGEIRDYIPNRHAGLRAVGLPSDDSQLAFWTLEHLVEHGQIL